MELRDETPAYTAEMVDAIDAPRTVAADHAAITMLTPSYGQTSRDAWFAALYAGSFDTV